MIEATKYISKVCEALLDAEAWHATKYISDKLVVTATRKLFSKKISKRENIDIILKIGKPNFVERQFIKNCKKAGEPFPVRNIILKFPPWAKK